MITYSYQKAAVDAGLLKTHINASSDLSQDADGVSWSGPDILKVFFVSDLTQGEQVALEAIVNAHDASGGGTYQANHYRRTPANGFMQKEEWFETIDAQAGVLTGLAKRITYTTSGGKITAYMIETFFRDGTVATIDSYRCWTDSSKNYIEERVI
ncbi:MAG: hypothetical protein A2Y38_04215 [Spirochaetes bacterium GWB1_59_5]|nr:MAG: hypothetical protein A2Y38_04215 [Spirochaetes bacterium GWB1_59_5]